MRLLGLGAALAMLLFAPVSVWATEPSGRGSQPVASSDDFDCMISLKAIRRGTPRFGDYPAPAESGLRAAPLVITPNIRFVRTNMRRSYAGGPNFAGHYTVAAVFAGTSGMMWAIVDARTGRVVPKALGSWWFGDLDDDENDNIGRGEGYPGVRFRRDSRLIMFLGKTDSGDDPEGVTYYEWTGDQLKRILFIPKAKSCIRRPIDGPLVKK